MRFEHNVVSFVKIEC